MNCPEAQAIVAAWLPTTDLPDPVVAHLDACDACRTAFDARFVPIPRPEAPPAPAARPRRSPWPALTALAAAAALWLALPLRPPAGPTARLDLSVCPLEDWQPPECPPA